MSVLPTNYPRGPIVVIDPPQATLSQRTPLDSDPRSHLVLSYSVFSFKSAELTTTNYTFIDVSIACQVVFSARGSYAITPSNTSELNHIVSYSWSLHPMQLGASSSASSSIRASSPQRSRSLDESSEHVQATRRRRNAHEDPFSDRSEASSDSALGKRQKPKLLGQARQPAKYSVLDETSPVLALDALSMRSGRYVIRHECFSFLVRNHWFYLRQ